MEFIYNQPVKTKMPIDIMHPTSRALFRFWETARGEMSAAVKQRLKIKQIASILPNIAILQREELMPVYKWRLAGSGVCKIWGMEVTGLDALHGWPDFERQTLASGFDMVIATMQPCVVRFKAVSAHGDEIGLEMLALPIQDEKTGSIQLLSSVVSFQTPEWLGKRNLLGYEISAIRKIWTNALPGDALVDSVPAKFGNDSRNHPFLRVIDGGRSLK